MLFSMDAWAGLADGTITRTFRTWSRPQAKAGGRYRVAGMLLEAIAVRQVELASLTDADAVAAGEANLDALLARLLGQGATPAGTVWRIDLRYLGDDDRTVRGNDTVVGDVELNGIRARLDRADASSPEGPWTREVLRLIAEQPGTVSTVIAEQVGIERFELKRRIRRLKEMGLTQSLRVGYQLSPRGQTVLDALQDPGADDA